MSDSISIVIVSCDRYKDLWDSFFYCFFKYWPDCDFKVYLISNYEVFNDNRVTQVQIGNDLSYTENLLRGIEKIDSEWILLWLEDCMFSSKIDNQRVNRIIDLAVSTPNLGYLKLSNDLPLSYEVEKLKLIGKLPKGIRYRSAIGMALYRKDVLVKLLVPGETAWQADKSSLSDNFDEDFYALSSSFFHNPLLPYENTVIKGKWNRSAIDFLKKHKFNEMIVKRDMQSYYSYFYNILFYIWSYMLKSFKIYWYR